MDLRDCQNTRQGQLDALEARRNPTGETPSRLWTSAGILMEICYLLHRAHMDTLAVRGLSVTPSSEKPTPFLRPNQIEDLCLRYPLQTRSSEPTCLIIPALSIPVVTTYTDTLACYYACYLFLRSVTSTRLGTTQHSFVNTALL